MDEASTILIRRWGLTHVHLKLAETYGLAPKAAMIVEPNSDHPYRRLRVVFNNTVGKTTREFVALFTNAPKPDTIEKTIKKTFSEAAAIIPEMRDLNETCRRYYRDSEYQRSRTFSPQKPAPKRGHRGNTRYWGM